jgi:putative restriction endonuclease
MAGGFEFGGERIPLINPQRGIFKPRQMEHLLSIKTVFPRRGARVWYDDQREAHRRIYTGEEVVDYAFMGTDPNSADNRLLLDAMQQQIPVIYFPRHVAGSISADYPDIHRGLASRAATGSACLSEPL